MASGKKTANFSNLTQSQCDEDEDEDELAEGSPNRCNMADLVDNLVKLKSGELYYLVFVRDKTSAEIAQSRLVSARSCVAALSISLWLYHCNCVGTRRASRHQGAELLNLARENGFPAFSSRKGLRSVKALRSLIVPAAQKNLCSALSSSV